MIIKEIKIRFFRSIRKMELECQSLMMLIGSNNHGKSNVLKALEFALSSSFKPSKEDFFSSSSDNRRNELWVELEFSNLSDQELITFKKYTSVKKTLKIRKTAILDENDKCSIKYNGYLNEPLKWILTEEAAKELTSKLKIEQILNDNPELEPLAEMKGRITKTVIEQFQQKYIEEHLEELEFREILQESPFMGSKTIASGILPEFYLIPAVKELNEETKIKNTTTFGKILNRAIQAMASNNPQYIELKDKLNTLVNSLNINNDTKINRPLELSMMEDSIETELSNWGVKIEIEVEAPEIDKIFELGTQLHVDDGLRTPADRKGHGLQRAIIVALVRAWNNILSETYGDMNTSSRKSSESVVFAIEEPELYLHPHAQRDLYKSLVGLSKELNYQVWFTTHSTHFVDLESYKGIAIIRKDNSHDGSKSFQYKDELFKGDDATSRKERFHMAYWINPDRAEMLFAKKTIFVEGETEAAVLPYIANMLNLNHSNVSVIDCGGKNNLPLYISIANAFKLNYVVLHDEDPFPDVHPEEWSKDKIRHKKETFALNKILNKMINPSIGKIYMFSEDFEKANGISKSQGKRKGKTLAALDTLSELDENTLPMPLKKALALGYDYEIHKKDFPEK